MVVNKRKKVTKYRAHTTHGGGHRKKRRGAGNRGGRGRAGSGKRGKGRKPSFPKLGKHGFFSLKKKKKLRTINLNQLTSLIKNKKLTEKEGIIDLASLGYHKLLGAGKLSQKLKLKINRFSKQAEEKISSAGGEILSKNIAENKPKPENLPEKPKKEGIKKEIPEE